MNKKRAKIPIFFVIVIFGLALTSTLIYFALNETSAFKIISNSLATPFVPNKTPFDNFESQSVDLYFVKSIFENRKTFLNCPKDDYFADKILKRGYYPDLEIIHRLLKMMLVSNNDFNDFIMDIGGNFGSIAVPLGKLGYNIIAFEPLKSNINMFKLNIFVNAISEKVFLIEKGLGNKEESLYITTFDMKKTVLGDGNKYRSNGLVVRNKDGLEVLSELVKEKLGGENVQFKELESIELTTLDGIFEQWKEDRSILPKKFKSLIQIKFIKIDCEGFEVFVFEGGMKFLKKVMPVIYTEVNKHFIERNNKNFNDMFQPLIDIGYVIVNEGLSKHVSIKNLPIFSNVFLFPKDSLFYRRVVKPTLSTY